MNKKAFCMLIIATICTTMMWSAVSGNDRTAATQLGDVDQNKIVNAEDALLVLKQAAKMIELTDEQKMLGNVNKDQTEDATDALWILQYAAGLYETFSSMSLPQRPDLVPEQLIPLQYAEKNTETSGSVITIQYETKDYFGDEHEITKDAYVYLPPEYDETKQYNVMYLMHGVGGTKTEWMINRQDSHVKNYFDNLIALGEIEPIIAVFPTGRSCADYNDTSNNGMNENMNAFYLFGKELRNDLIPYIDANFATYAEYEPGYDMTKARDHRAMAGFSMGGMQTVNIGICECLDIISNFGAFSAAPTTYSANQINEHLRAFGEFDIKLFYNVCGSSDATALGSHKAAVDGLVEGSGKRLMDHKNFIWHQVSGGHSMGVWYVGIYNFARMAFCDTL